MPTMKPFFSIASVKFCEIFCGFQILGCTSYKKVVILQAKCAKTTF